MQLISKLIFVLTFLLFCSCSPLSGDNLTPDTYSSSESREVPPRDTSNDEDDDDEDDDEDDDDEDDDDENDDENEDEPADIEAIKREDEFPDKETPEVGTLPITSEL